MRELALCQTSAFDCSPVRSRFRSDLRDPIARVELSRVSAAPERFELRRGANLPQEGSLRDYFRRRPGSGGPSPLPMFARDEYRARARNKWAVRRVGRRGCGELKPQAAGQPERSAGLPVRHFVGKFVRIGQTVAHGLGIDRLGRERPSARCPRQKGDQSGDRNQHSIHRDPPIPV
jgi:hypothetical protein